MNRAYFARLLMSPEGSDGGNGATDTPPAADKSTGTTDPALKVVESLTSQLGNEKAAAVRLAGENHKYRERIRELEAKVPPDGHRVLAPDDAKAFDAYRELGPAAELRTKIEAGQQATGELAVLRKADTVRAAAELHGFRGNVLAPLVEKLDLRIVDGWKGPDGKAAPAKAAMVVTKGDDGKEAETPLPEFVDANLRDFLPALKAEARPGPMLPPRPAASGHAGNPRADDRERQILAALPRL
jgi:hypothetical protein